MLNLSEIKRLYRTKEDHFTQETHEGELFGLSNDPRKLFKDLCKHIIGSQQDWNKVVAVVDRLDKCGILWMGDAEAIGGSLKDLGLRFHSKGGQRLHDAREMLYSGQPDSAILKLVQRLRQLSDCDPIRARDALAGRQSEEDIPRIRGIGMKWASHFLRDLGLSRNKLAILDRQVMTALKELDVTKRDSIPTPDVYLEVESKLKEWAEDKLPEIPLDHLDLVLWEMMRMRHKGSSRVDPVLQCGHA